MNSYLQMLMSVNLEMEVVNMGVITPLALITAPAILDINCILRGINVKVRTVTIELIINISMWLHGYIYMVQLNGNLTPVHRQRVQHPRVILCGMLHGMCYQGCVEESMRWFL